jgi:hypothetical protein
MGFWSTLGKIGGIAGPIAAAPFTGGGSLLGLLGASAPVASAIGAGLGVAGKLASGASQQRAQDRGAQAEYDALRVPLQNSQQLQHAQARLGADRSRMGQIAGADMLGNFTAPTDPRAAKFQNNGQLSGGQIDPATIAMMRQRAMSALDSGSDIPQMQQLPTKPGGGATGMDSFLNALSLGSTALGGLRESGILNRQPQAVTRPGSPVGQVVFPNEQEPWWSPLRRGN